MAILTPNESRLKENERYRSLIISYKQRLGSEINDFRKRDLAELMAEAETKYNKKIPGQIGAANALFYDRRSGQGVCKRVLLQNGDKNGAEMHKSVTNAQKAVMHFLHTGFLTVDEEMTVALEEKNKSPINGASIGLTAALLILSKLMSLEIPGNFAFSAEINEYGDLQPVDFIEEKITAALEFNKHISFILTAEGQQVENESGISVKKVSNLEKAVREVWGDEIYQKVFLPEINNPQKKLQALEYYKKMQDNRKTEDIAKEICKDLKNSKKYSDRTLYAYALSVIGMQYTHESKLEKVEHYLKEARTVLDNLADNVDPAIPVYKTYNAYGIYLLDNYRYSEALDEFNRALNFLEDRKYPKFYKIETWNSLGQLYSKTDRFEKGNGYLNFSLDESKACYEYRDFSRIYCYLAENCIYSKKYSKAKRWLKLANDEMNPAKPMQQFFNDFYRAMLFYHWNKKEDFIELFENIIYPNYLENPVHSSAHRGMMHSWAASFYVMPEKRDFHCQAAIQLLNKKNDPFTSILLLKTEATHRLRNGEILLLDDSEVVRIIKDAVKKSDFLQENLPSIPQSKKDWQAIENVIKF